MNKDQILTRIRELESNTEKYNAELYVLNNELLSLYKELNKNGKLSENNTQPGPMLLVE
jgi:hypothetical protein